MNIYNNEIFYLEKKGERIYLKEIELKILFNYLKMKIEQIFRKIILIHIHS